MKPSKPLFLLMTLFLFSCAIIAQGTDKGSSNIDQNYHQEVVNISKDGLIKGLDAVKAFWTDFQNSNGDRLNHQELYSIAVLELLEYAIGTFETEKGNSYIDLAIWLKGTEDKKKVLEAVYEKKSSSLDENEINQARKKWMELCNQHNASQLVKALYTEDAIYYNRGRVLRGHDQISNEYSYMNNPSYTLKLNPKALEMVTDGIAFEIGQCSGSYTLPYMLIWKRQNNGEWRIYFDSNY